MGYDPQDIVAGSSKQFVLQNATLNGSPSAWPGDTQVTLYLAPPLPGGQPYPPTAPTTFGGATGYAATGVTITGSGLSASYTTVKVGSGYAGDLNVNTPGYWARWWLVSSVSTGLFDLIGYDTFLVKQSPLQPR